MSKGNGKGMQNVAEDNAGRRVESSRVELSSSSSGLSAYSAHPEETWRCGHYDGRRNDDEDVGLRRGNYDERLDDSFSRRTENYSHAVPFSSVAKLTDVLNE